MSDFGDGSDGSGFGGSGSGFGDPFGGMSTAGAGMPSSFGDPFAPVAGGTGFGGLPSGGLGTPAFGDPFASVAGGTGFGGLPLGGLGTPGFGDPSTSALAGNGFDGLPAGGLGAPGFGVNGSGEPFAGSRGAAMPGAGMPVADFGDPLGGAFAAASGQSALDPGSQLDAGFAATPAPASSLAAGAAGPSPSPEPSALTGGAPSAGTTRLPENLDLAYLPGTSLGRLNDGLGTAESALRDPATLARLADAGTLTVAGSEQTRDLDLTVNGDDYELRITLTPTADGGTQRVLTYSDVDGKTLREVTDDPPAAALVLPSPSPPVELDPSRATRDPVATPTDATPTPTNAAPIAPDPAEPTRPAPIALDPSRPDAPSVDVAPQPALPPDLARILQPTEPAPQHGPMIAGPPWTAFPPGPTPTSNSYPPFATLGPVDRAIATPLVAQLSKDLGVPLRGDRVLEAPWLGRIADKSGGFKEANSLGYRRNADRFWSTYKDAFRSHGLGNDTKVTEAFARSQGWVDNAGKARFVGERLHHHHIGNGPYVVALPESLHNKKNPAFYRIHARERIVGTPKAGLLAGVAGAGLLLWGAVAHANAATHNLHRGADPGPAVQRAIALLDQRYGKPEQLRASQRGDAAAAARWLHENGVGALLNPDRVGLSTISGHLTTLRSTVWALERLEDGYRAPLADLARLRTVLDARVKALQDATDTLASFVQTGVPFADQYAPIWKAFNDATLEIAELRGAVHNAQQRFESALAQARAERNQAAKTFNYWAPAFAHADGGVGNDPVRLPER